MSLEDALGSVLSRAFFADPVLTWVLPEDEERKQLTPWFTAMVRWGLQFGDVKYLGSEAKPKAVAIWGSRPATFVEHVRAGVVWPTVALGLRATTRFVKLGNVLTENHRALCPEEHRYLYFLGVDPAHQRKGLGSELLMPSLDEADGRQVPCYLETASEQNVAFYSRLRFKTAWEGEVVQGAPRFWLLKRAPRST